MVGRRPPHQRRLAGWSPVSTGWPCAVAVACLLALIASLTPAAATAAANTKATRYTPFGPDGQINPDLQLVPRTGGDCWTSSSVTRRHDAWRCSEHNVIRDPCFLGADPQSVVCPIDGPFSGRAVLLGVISGLHSSMAGTDAPSPPWALELVDGRQCTFADGATTAIGRLRLNYVCSTGRRALWGNPKTATASWTILQGSPGARRRSQLRPVAITSAWF